MAYFFGPPGRPNAWCQRQMRFNNLSRVVLDSADAGTEAAIASRKSNVRPLPATPPTSERRDFQCFTVYKLWNRTPAELRRV